MKSNRDLSPDEVVRMSLSEFELHFGFRPSDALEKYWFAINAARLDDVCREALEAGIMGDIPNLDHVIME